MKKCLLTTALALANFIAISQSDIVYMFSYFKDNGQDGLHLAWSHDALTWKSLKGDSSFLTPTVAKDKLMRDPCIIRGADDRFHMVWTVSWNDRGIGYANSTDLKTHNEWIVYFDKYTNHTYGAVSSTDLEHWTDISGKVSFPEGARHGSVFTITKQEFASFFHNP